MRFKVIDWLLIVTYMNSIIMFIISLNMAYFCYLRHEREIHQAPSLSHITTIHKHYSSSSSLSSLFGRKKSVIYLSGISSLSMKWSELKMLHFHHTNVNQFQYAKRSRNYDTETHLEWDLIKRNMQGIERLCEKEYVSCEKVTTWSVINGNSLFWDDHYIAI